MIHLARRVEMKAICPLLVIAAVWCIAPALSSVIREGKEEQDTNEGPSCLQNVVANSGNARGSVIKFLCAYLQFKDLPDKTEFVQAIRLLEDGTQCKTEDIFGRSQSPEQVAMDENGVLTNQIQSMKQILEQSGVSLISVEAVCVLMNNVKCTDSVSHKEENGQGKIRTARQLGGLLGIANAVPSLLNGGLLGGILGGQRQGYGAGGNGVLQGLLPGLGGILELGPLLNLPTHLLTGLLPGLLGNGGLGSLLNTPFNILGGLGLGGGGGLSGGFSFPGSHLGGQSTGYGGGGGFGAGLSSGNLLGGLGGTLGGVTKGLGGAVGQVTQALGGLTGGLTGGGSGGSGKILGLL